MPGDISDITGIRDLRYQLCRPRMKHGDVIAFSGKSRLSELIKWRTRSPYSHVGLVLRWSLGNGFGDTVMLIESTTLTDLPDAVHGEIIKGVQIHRLAERLAGYQGRVWWSELKQPIAPEKLDAADQWLRTTHERRTQYDSLQAIGSGIDWWDRLGFTNDPDFSTLFCSELVGRYHQIAGLWPENENMSEKDPNDIVEAPYLLEPVLISMNGGG